MSQTTVTWVKDLQFIGTDSTNHSVVISSPKDGVGMKPSELMASALGSCTGYDVVTILKKRRQNLAGLEVQVTSEQSDEAPYAFKKFHIHYVVSGEGLQAKDVEKAIALSEEKYCSVAATLRQAAEITWDYEICEHSE